MCLAEGFWGGGGKCNVLLGASDLCFCWHLSDKKLIFNFPLEQTWVSSGGADITGLSSAPSLVTTSNNSVQLHAFSSVGLYDTVFDVDHDKERAQAQGLEPNGFSFDGADAAGVDYALNR